METFTAALYLCLLTFSSLGALFAGVPHWAFMPFGLTVDSTPGTPGALTLSSLRLAGYLLLVFALIIAHALARMLVSTSAAIALLASHSRCVNL